MTTREEIVTTMRQFLAGSHPERTVVVDSDANLFSLGLLDSLGIVSLVLFIEDTLGVSLAYDDLSEENLGSLDAIADMVLRYDRQGGASR